jgi:glycosyl transferase family 25
MRALVRRIPQRYRLRLWLLRDYVRPESFRRRRAQPSPARRLVAKAVIARRKRLLGRSDGPVGVERLSAVRVINLESRPDRLSSFEAEMERLRIDRVDRFEAVANENGALGCALSHRECLTQMQENGWDCVMVCEDDARFLVDRGGLDVLVDEFLDDPAAEVACLAYFVWESEPHGALYLRGLRVQTTACYVIKSSIADELLEAWQEGIDGLVDGGSPKQYGCDRVWMPLQRRRIFVAPAVRAAYQEPGYSDVEGRVVGYTH